MKKKLSFIFPGQGAQYVGMGYDFYQNFPTAKRVYEEADDLFHEKLSHLIFHGQEAELTQTKNSQPAIFVTSLAILHVLHELFPELTPYACAGLSLGEYSALVAAKKLSFTEGLPLVFARGKCMHEACEEQKGTMAAIFGLDDEAVVGVVESLHIPQEVSCANFNCPGQVVISGTIKGVDAASQALLAKGAKRVIPLQVHGAFHSILMKSAQEKLAQKLVDTKILKSDCKVATNVTGDFCDDPEAIKEILIQQVVSPVRWHQAIRAIDATNIDAFLEIGCGKTLSGMNKRIGVKATTYNIEKIEDLKKLEEYLQ